MSRISRRLIAALVLFTTVAITVLPRPAQAHPVHSTLAVVVVDATGVTIRLRAFADDFSSAVAKFAGKQAPRDSSASSTDVARYATARFGVTTAAGASVPLELCGVERARELYWVCLRVPSTSGLRGLKLRNLVLTELHADQVNVVQIQRAGANRTMLFTRESPPATIER